MEVTPANLALDDFIIDAYQVNQDPLDYKVLKAHMFTKGLGVFGFVYACTDTRTAYIFQLDPDLESILPDEPPETFVQQCERQLLPNYKKNYIFFM